VSVHITVLSLSKDEDILVF